MEKTAILDIGTNSIKFNVFELKEDKIVTLIDENSITRLGENLQKSNRLEKAAMQRNLHAIKDFQKTAQQEDVKRIFAVGTMCLRKAENSSEFINLVKNETGIEIKVLSGEEEAYYSHLAITESSGIAAESFIVIDSGGGSTEFIFSNNGQIKKKFSLDIGAVYPTEKFFLHNPVSAGEISAAEEYIENLIKNKIGQTEGELIGIGGTMTSLAAVYHKMEKYEAEIVHGTRLKLSEIGELAEDFALKTIAERRQIPGLQPKRAEVILAGSLIIKAIMKLMGKEVITVSDRGLRHGLQTALVKGKL